MLFLGGSSPVKGIGVRRPRDQQSPRVASRCEEVADLLDMRNPVDGSDIIIEDEFLAPGYGRTNEAVLEAIELAARHEGIILDPVYSGRTMAGFLGAAGRAADGQTLLFLHTGGQPAVFGYEADLTPVLSDGI